MFSIIIPAHNEASVIGRCLENLLADGEAGDAEIFVVCNGCSDNTAEIAASFNGVKVVDIKTASKIAALNAGDSAASSYPRVYLDADVLVSGASLNNAVRALEENGVEAVAPGVNIDVSKSSLLVKAFYAVWLKLPYFADKHMIGSGVYILSKAGRERFGDFPNIISDDGFVRSRFTASERKTVQSCRFTIFAPRTLANLIKIKTRARFGNMQVVKLYPGSQLGGENTGSAFAKLFLHKPWLLPCAPVYMFAQWRTKVNSLRKFREQDFSTWERDESAR